MLRSVSKTVTRMAAAAHELKRPVSPSNRVHGPAKKRHFKGKGAAKQQAKKEKAKRDNPSTLPSQVIELLGGERKVETWDLVYGSVVEVRIASLTSGGEGLGLSPDGQWVVVVPFVVPGDLVKAKLYKQGDDWGYAHADLVEVVEPGESRDDSLVGCKYFGKCLAHPLPLPHHADAAAGSGCQVRSHHPRRRFELTCRQYQMIPYERQLELKRNVVERAYKYLSGRPHPQPPTLSSHTKKGLASDDIPPTLPTLPSPLKYGYRTKLTPHFNPPRANQPVAIGFEKKDGKGVLDIEECPLASTTINARLTEERKRVQESVHPAQVPKRG